MPILGYTIGLAGGSFLVGQPKRSSYLNTLFLELSCSMVYLNCSGIRFGSPIDEKHLFQWALEISGVLRWEQDTLVVRSRRICEEALRDLLAHFSRYNIPMAQLSQFKNSRNAA